MIFMLKFMSWRTLPARVFGIGLLLIAGIALAFYLVLARGAKSSVTEQLLAKEQTVARAEASNIVSFFKVFGDSMVVLSQLTSIDRRDSQTLQDMDAFVKKWRDTDLIGGIVLTNSSGIAEFNSNVLGTRDTGVSLADRDYFLWAKNKPKEGEYFVGKPVFSRLGGSKGQLIVPAAAPVYQKGIFTGVMAASVKLQPLTNRFLGLMKVSDQTDVFLIDQDGNMLYNSVSNNLESNISELFGNNIKNILNTTQEGNFEATIVNPKSGRSEDRLVAYSPVSLGNQNWLLIMASPIHGVVDLTTPFYIREISILILVSLTILLFGVIVAREVEARAQDQKSL